ncbi:MAG: FAD-dependent oxidoreductase, partial [Candidatus Micrarchaeia archaeon]
VIVSTVAPEVILNLVDKLPEDVERQLRKIRYLSCICMTAGLKKEFTDRYWMNVLDKDKPFSAVFNHTALYEDAAPAGKSVFFVATYLMRDEPLWKKSDEEIKNIYVEALNKILPGFKYNIEWWRIFKIEYAEAIYRTGFINPPMFTDGLYFAGIYRIYPKIRNMSSAMEEGLAVATKIEENVKNV